MTDTNEKIRSLFLTALMVFGVFAGTVAFTGGAAAANISSSTFYSGQEVTVEDLPSNNIDYQVRTVDEDNNVGSLARTLTPQNNEVTFDTDGRLSEGSFVIVRADNQNVIDLYGDGNASAANDQFEVVAQDLTAEFDDDTAGTSGDSANVDFEIASDVRNDYDVNVSAEGLDAEELESIFGENNVSNVDTEEERITIDNAEATWELDFTNVDTGNYTFETNVTDADASDADTIEVVSTDDENAGFAQSVVEEQRGDVAEVTVQLENTDTALVQIGDESDDGYYLTAEVEDGNDDGEVTVEFNSFLAGAVAGDDVVSPADSDDNVDALSQGGDFTDVTNKSAGGDVLAATDYDILAAAGSQSSDAYNSTTGTIEDEQSFATLSLTERSTDGLQVWTAPEDSLNNDLSDADAADVYSLVESNNLTQTDTIAEEDVAVIQVQASGLEGAVEADSYANLSGTAFEHEIEAAAANPNSDSASVSVASVSSDVIYDEANDTHFVVIDSTAITNEFNHDDGDEYEANFTMLDTTDLSEDNVSVSDSFTIEDRDATLNDGEDITVEAADDQQVTGQTNVAPGTELTVRMRSTTSGSPFLVQPTTYVGANGSYTATADFSDYSPGANFTAQTRISGDNLGDEVDGSIVEATNDSDNGTATPTPGTETETGTDMTETETGMTETATEGGASPTEGGMSPTEGGDTPAAGTETPTSGDGPGFTAIVALVALVAAALLAVRRDN
ncbi:BGTF surface domain-containing protein [Haloarcula nitratireducens]|uniref:Surface glycoprotein n=1 Tax=Haloarcula nitratireducens TaxID=2487749 RepID=A0AAW4PAY0_9EURY|nr:BGTF surface domain-containing protein [Halomicroarcula nitratireducens]MBX0294635.1 surface glycoprotein [Halomicroarcula nitratireducens]